MIGYTGRVSAPIELDRIVVVRDGRAILDRVSLRVEAGERWVVLGGNGSGKTTLMRIAALYEHPTSGEVRILGERLGSTDIRVLRRRVGWVSAALAQQLRPESTALDVVMTARYAALEPWWHEYDDADRQRARHLLERHGIGDLGDRTIATLSSGERQRVLLARSLMNDPAVVLLDEPAAGLDVAAREQLIQALDDLSTGPVAAPPYVLVTHHVEEIPARATHALLLRAGRATAAGPIDLALTSENLSACFGVPLVIERSAGGRFSARLDR